MIKRFKISIFIISVFFAGFLFLSLNSEAQQTPQCDLSSVVFTPNGTQAQSWFNRGNRPSFTVTLQANGNCGGKILNNVALVNTPGINNDIEALNDEPVTFHQGSNRMVFTFIAGEEGCDAFPGRNDCQIRLNVQSDVGNFWSNQISGSLGELNYECDNRFRICDEDITFQLVSVQGGRIGSFPPTSQNSICAYIASDNRYACIPNSNQQASQNQCSQVAECQGRNCLVINPSLCAQDAGGGPGDGEGQPGQDVSVDFNIPNPIQAESLIDLAKAIGKFLFQIAIPIAVIIIIYAGLLYLTSGGNKEKVATAHKALWYAVIGLAVILIGQGFFTLIKSILDLGGPGP